MLNSSNSGRQQKLSIWLLVFLVVKSRQYICEADLQGQTIDVCEDLVDQVTEIPKLTCNDKRLIEFRIPSEIRGTAGDVANDANKPQEEEIYTIEVPSSSDDVAKLYPKDEFSNQHHLDPKIDLGQYCDSGDEFSLFLQRKKDLATVATGLSSNGNFIASRDLNDTDKNIWSKPSIYFIESSQNHKTLDVANDLYFPEIERAVCEMKPSTASESSEPPYITWTCLFESERVLLRVTTADDPSLRFTLISFRNGQPITNHGIVILQRKAKPLQFSNLCDVESQSSVHSTNNYFEIIYTSEIFDAQCVDSNPIIDELESIANLKEVKYILGYHIPYKASMNKCLSVYQSHGEIFESIIRQYSPETASLTTKEIKIRKIVIILIVVSAVVVAVLASVIVFCMKKRKKKNKTDQSGTNNFAKQDNRDYSLNEEKTKGNQKPNRNDNEDAHDDRSIKKGIDNHQRKMGERKAHSKDNTAHDDSIRLGNNDMPKENLKAVKKAANKNIQAPKKQSQEDYECDYYGMSVMNPSNGNLKSNKREKKGNIQRCENLIPENSIYDDNGMSVMNPLKGKMKTVNKEGKKKIQGNKKAIPENSIYDDYGNSVRISPEGSL